MTMSAKLFGRFGGLVATVVALSAAVVAAGACGTATNPDWDSGANPGGGSSSGGNSTSSSGGLGNAPIPGGEGGIFFVDATAPMPEAGTGSSSGGQTIISTAINPSFPAPDCAGCTFPPANASPCPSTAPAITLLYPNDNVLVPPNLNVISVHWTPYGPPYSMYSVEFSNAPNTDWHIITKCTNQTIDAQSGMPSGGCEVVVDPVSWSKLVAANRDGGAITITVRGTTDGTCATPSSNQVHMSIAKDDLLGTYYYWKSTIKSTQRQGGVGGQIWKKTFGDLVNAEQDVTSAAINATCNGCHVLSRDGTRMVVYSDDNDSDDEYSDIAGSYLDMTTNPATEFPGGVTQGGHQGGGQVAGFSTIDPNVTALTTPTAQGYYITSNGYPCPPGGGACGSATTGYTTPVPLNGFSVWNGTTGAFINGVTVGAATTRPTMPDWAPDGKTIVYVVPAGEFSSWRDDDAHIYGGSLWTVPYAGTGAFGPTPTEILHSNGENNYYPSFSPDVSMSAGPSFILFNRVDNMNAGATCTTGFCLDDSFSNPAARLMLMAAPGGPFGAAPGMPIDLEKANGTPIVAKKPWSNSYPRWAPFVQTYHGNKILWFTFSSTRDYGARVLNHKTGMYQCYPSDAAETPGASHGQSFAPQCQEPQLWMAPLTFSEGQSLNKDPSGPAFWLPYQDISTHNHTAQWTQEHPKIVVPPMVDAGCSCQSQVYGVCGAANGGCDCCAGSGLTCTGSNTCFAPPH